MSDEESRGLALMEEGNKLLKRQSIWNVFSQTQRFEDAKESFTKAANLFKMSKSWFNAGAAYERCADMDDALQNMHEAVNNRVLAAEAYRRVDPNKAATLYRTVVAVNCELGRFGRAAQLLEIVGEILEGQNNVEEALDAYSKAADYYSSENAGSRANKCLEKIALLSASAGAYDHSARTFEQLGTTALESNLLKFGAKKHFMHSGFCYLARGDVVAARMAYDRYAQMDLSFHGSREAKVLDEVIVAYEGNDSDAFSTALSDYDRVCTLNAWETSILLRIKKTIEETAAAPPDLR